MWKKEIHAQQQNYHAVYNYVAVIYQIHFVIDNDYEFSLILYILEFAQRMNNNSICE